MEATQEDFERAVREAFAAEAVELLRQVERALHGAVGALQPAEREEQCIELLRGLHTLKGSAAVAGQEQVNQLAHAMEERVRAVLSGGGALSGGALEDLSMVLERIYAAVEGAFGVSARVESRPAAAPASAAPAPGALAIVAGAGAGAPGSPPEPASPRGGAEELLRVKPARVEALHALMGELTIYRLQQEEVGRRLQEARGRLAEAAEHWKALHAQVDGLQRLLPMEHWVPLKAAREACGPVLTDAAQLLTGVAREAPQLLSHAAAVEAALEQGLRELRLMPLQPFFEDFGRVVRETARAAGKEVRLVIHAEGAEVDRVVLLRLRDSLLHLVRNAVVHGMEPVEVRRARGKPEAGTLTLEGRCEGARALLRVADDGGGIDVVKVKQRARQLGFLTGQDRALDSDELLSLLTRPGFSTREHADMLAGRGIGMDVVAAALQDLDGRLRLEYTPGGGTAFLLDVPITASTSRGLVVEAASARFGLLLLNVERLIRVGTREMGQVEGRPTVQVGSEPVAVVPLSGLLGAGVRALPEHRLPALVLRQGRQRLCVLVDDVIEEQTLVIKPLPPAFSGAPLVLGGALQPDGSVLPVLQAAALFERASGGALAAGAHPPLVPERPAAPPSVLVVDDSITMRTLLRNVLQGAGYDVTVAFDGVSAVEQFERRPTDLVITDLQMPRLDGVGVCQAVRRSGRPRTPVVLVTSVGAPEERRRALEAGADAYVVKGDFEQVGFLRLVRELAGAARARG